MRIGSNKCMRFSRNISIIFVNFHFSEKIETLADKNNIKSSVKVRSSILSNTAVNADY